MLTYHVRGCLEEVGSINRTRSATVQLYIPVDTSVHNHYESLSMFNEIDVDELLYIDSLAWVYLSPSHPHMVNFFRRICNQTAAEILWTASL